MKTERSAVASVLVATAPERMPEGKGKKDASHGLSAMAFAPLVVPKSAPKRAPKEQSVRLCQQVRKKPTVQFNSESNDCSFEDPESELEPDLESPELEPNLYPPLPESNAESEDGSVCSAHRRQVVGLGDAQLQQLLQKLKALETQDKATGTSGSMELEHKQEANAQLCFKSPIT